MSEQKKFNYHKISILFMIIASIFTAFGQLCWKLFEAKGLVFLILGFVLYGIGAIAMVIAFRGGELSVLYPIMCVGYIIALINGKVFLGEIVSATQVLGIILIIIGVIYMGLGGKE